MRSRTVVYPPAVIVAIAIAALIGLGAAFVIARDHFSGSTVNLGKPATPSARMALGAFNPAEIYAQRSASVVTVEAMIAGTPSSGSGVVVDKDGYIVTASHVVHDYKAGRDPDAIYVSFLSHDRVPAALVGVDTFSDIAVLKIDPTQVAPLHPAPFADSDRATVGEWIGVIGAPFGDESSLSTGIVSAIHRNEDSQIKANSQIAGMLQTDAAINRGNSGGPAFDAQGNVVGISQQITSDSGDSTGVAFLIPADTAMRSYQEIRTTGTVRQAWFGLTVWTMSPQFARRYQVPVSAGVLITSTAGPAVDAGLRGANATVSFMGETVPIGGDVITSIAGVPVTSKDDILQIAARLLPGQHVQVVYYRNGQRGTADLVTGQRA
jgi:S1-C subfamily serine protease